MAPFNIDLYGLAIIPVEERVCNCDEIKDESHVLMYCQLYDDFRNELIRINKTIPSFQFQELSVQDKFIQLMSNPIILSRCVKGHLLHFKQTSIYWL